MTGTSNANKSRFKTTVPDGDDWRTGTGARRILIVALLLFAMVISVAVWFGSEQSERIGDGVATAVPSDVDQIVERLQPQAAQSKRDIRARRAVQAERPDDVATLAALARSHFERARLSGDPRELGLAQAALATWWHRARPPGPVLLVRASIRQYQHDFDGALDDLRAVLEADPGNLQAWISQAAIQQTTGALAAAGTSCRRLLELARSMSAEICLADLASLGGDRTALDRALPIVRSRAASASELAWALTVLAEMAERLGRDDQAGQLFEAATRADSGSYAQVAYADWLLRKNRASEAVNALAGAPATDAVVLRRALAWRKLGDPSAIAAIADLRERFKSSQVRDDSLHLREMARFALEIDNDPALALDYADRNWALQKEPADALLLAAAARAAGSPQAADAVRRFVEVPGLDDVRLYEIL